MVKSLTFVHPEIKKKAFFCVKMFYYKNVIKYFLFYIYISIYKITCGQYIDRCREMSSIHRCGILLVSM